MCGRYTRYLPWSEIHRLYRLTARPMSGATMRRVQYRADRRGAFHHRRR